MKHCMILLILLFSACAPSDVFRRPHQDLAEQIVWNIWYGQKDPAPVLEWKTEGLDCANGFGWNDVDHDGLIGSHQCVAGIFYDYLDYGFVALKDETQRFSGTGYAHELLHGLFWRLYNDGDGHCRPEWGTAQDRKCNPNPVDGILDWAKEDLKNAGL